MQVTWECLEKAIEIGLRFTFSSSQALIYLLHFTVKPGVKYRDVGAVIQKHAQSNGFSVVRSYCGHGIHQLFHTAPNVPHYASMLTLNYAYVEFLLLRKVT